MAATYKFDKLRLGSTCRKIELSVCMLTLILVERRHTLQLHLLRATWGHANPEYSGSVVMLEQGCI